MPELPEVETIRNDLQKEIVGRTIISVNGDWPKTVRKPSFKDFIKEIEGKKIKSIERRGKNLIIVLDSKYLWVHFKMTGHMIIADAKKLKGVYFEDDEKDSPLNDRVNRYIHLAFYLDDGRVLALSDLRKFARVALVDKEELDELLADLGPEPLADDFSFEVFKERLKGRKGLIKKVLLEQDVIVGIGNIYGDEILFDAKISPLTHVPNLSEEQLLSLYKSTKKVLETAVKSRGTSTSDFRDASGRKGGYTEIRNVYRRTGEPCNSACGGVVERVKIAGRSTHYCPKCQFVEGKE